MVDCRPASFWSRIFVLPLGTDRRLPRVHLRAIRRACPTGGINGQERVAEGTGTSRTLAAAILDHEVQLELLESELRLLDIRSIPTRSVTLDHEVLQHLKEWRGLLG